MGALIVIIVVVMIVATKLTRVNTDNAPKQRYQQWQAQLKAGQIPTATAQPKAAAPKPAAARNKRQQSVSQKHHPQAPSSAKPAAAPAAAVVHHNRTLAQGRHEAGHESKLQRDARLHRKPLVPPKNQLKPPHKPLRKP